MQQAALAVAGQCPAQATAFSSRGDMHGQLQSDSGGCILLTCFLMPGCSASPNGFADRLGQGAVQPSSSAAFKAGFTQDPAVLAASYEQVGAAQVVLCWQRGCLTCAYVWRTSLAVLAVWYE